VLFIIFMRVSIGIFVYMFSISKEHILVFSSISIVCKSDVRCIVFLTYVYGNCRRFCNIVVKNFASLYAGAFIQLIIGLMGVLFLCSFIVAETCRETETMF
jgi:hypothetical protein